MADSDIADILPQRVHEQGAGPFERNDNGTFDPEAPLDRLLRSRSLPLA